MQATLEDAIALAALSHKGVKDKAGAPYILHPLRVLGFLGADAGEDERIVAVLHDVVEDCGVTLDDLAARGYPPQVLAALELVTKRGGEDYQDFIARLSPNPIARRVKLADLQDNMNLSRLPQITPSDHERLARYEAAKSFLEALG